MLAYLSTQELIALAVVCGLIVMLISAACCWLLCCNASDETRLLTFSRTAAAADEAETGLIHDTPVKRSPNGRSPARSLGHKSPLALVPVAHPSESWEEDEEDEEFEDDVDIHNGGVDDVLTMHTQDRAVLVLDRSVEEEEASSGHVFLE